MNRGPARGLPPRIYVPIVVLSGLAFLGIIGYFLKIGLGVTGAALGPTAQQGDANIQATAPGEVLVPQTGGAPAGGPNGVGGGTPVQGGANGPPAPVQRLLVDLRGRLQRNPGDRDALLGLASLYSDAGKYAQAVPYYTRALVLDPANARTRTDYAAALHGLGKDREALSELEAVLARQPSFAEALFNEGVVSAALGRRTQATAAFAKFLKLAPNDERAADARTALQDLGA